MMPSVWMPLSWLKVFEPTMGLSGGIARPAASATSAASPRRRVPSVAFLGRILPVNFVRNHCPPSRLWPLEEKL
jgi:hypothetical protein